MARNIHIVEIENLAKKYYRTSIIDGINLKIKRGTILGLLGPNGSGKSTLLKMIAGLARPTGGSILIEGEKPSTATKAQVAYLPEINHLYEWMTVAEITRFVASFYQDWQEERATELLEIFKLTPDEKVGRLSKGYITRLKLLLTLSRNVPLVLLDEPLSGIDPQSRSVIIEAILGEYRAEEQTLVITTHEIDETEAIFDEVAFIKEGRIVLCDSAENLRSNYNSSIGQLWEKVFSL
jgi:ABC-2 type transport system ATP-binding protein